MEGDQSSQKRGMSPDQPRKVAKTEYSQNVNTVRERQRIEAMDEERKAANDKRRAENEANRRVRERVKKSAGFNLLSSEEQQEKLDEALAKLSEKRASKTPKHHTALYDDPIGFYNRSVIEAQLYSALPKQDWLDSDDDSDIEVENDVLGQVQDPGQFKKQQSTNLPEALESAQYGARLKEILVRDWPFFSSFWCYAIESFWEKINSLDKYILGNLTADKSRISLTPKSFMRIANLNLKSIRKISIRSDTRKPKDMLGIFFPWSQIFKKKVIINRRYGEPRYRRKVVRPRQPKNKTTGDKSIKKKGNSAKKSNFLHNFTKCLSPIAKILGIVEYNHLRLQPHHVFTHLDRVIFRNVASWDSAFIKGDEIKLPGPAMLWPDDYDFQKHGFEPEQDAVAAKSIYMFIAKRKGMKKAPAEFNMMLKSQLELRWKLGGETDTFDMEY